MRECFALVSFPDLKVEAVDSRPYFFKPRLKRYNLSEPREEVLFPFILEAAVERGVYSADYSEFMAMKEMLLMSFKLFSLLGELNE